MTTPVEARTRCRRVWTRHGVRADLTITTRGGVVTEVGPARADDGPWVDGLVVPGLINAHAHVEHEPPAVEGGRGFVAWAGALMATPRPSDPDARAQELVQAGCAAVVDVSTGGATHDALARAGLHGIAQHELLGLDVDALPARLAVARSYADAPASDLTRRASPHALLSTALALVEACVRGGPASRPATLHLGETPDERELWTTGTGAAAALLDRLGRRWRPLVHPGDAPVARLDHLGVLGPGLLLVHALDVTPDERRLIARRRAPVVLCPRSNAHIEGRLPDVSAWRAVGATVLLGTDSRASAPDLDVLAELPHLAASPDGAAWLAAITHLAADALGLDHLGEITPGRRPGLVELDVGQPDDLLRGPPARRWLVRPPAPRP